MAKFNQDGKALQSEGVHFKTNKRKSVLQNANNLEKMKTIKVKRESIVDGK